MGSSGSKEKLAPPSETLQSHDKEINCMGLSEDESLLVTGSEDRTLRMWSTKTEATECLGILKGHTDYVTCVTISDVFILSGSADTTIRKWDMTTCECIFVYEGHTSRIYRIMCTTEFIFSTSNDRTAKIWFFDTNDGDSDDEDEFDQKCIRTFKGHTLSVIPIIFIPDQNDMKNSYDSDSDEEATLKPNDTVITGSSDCTVRIWNAVTSHSVHTLKGHLGPVTSMTTDPTGSTLYTGSADATIRTWNIGTGEALKEFTSHTSAILFITCKQKLLYSASADGTAKCWVREFGDCTRTYRGAKHSVVALRVKDGNVFTVSGDTCARVYDAKSGSMKKVFSGHLGAIQCMAVAGDKMYTAGADKLLKVWDISQLDAPKKGDEDEEEEEEKENKPDPALERQQKNLDDLDNRLDDINDPDLNMKP